MTLPRLLTALFTIPLVLAVIWFGSLPFYIFVFGLSLLCVWEFCVMADQGGYPNQMVLAMFGSMALVTSMYLDGLALWGPLHRSPSPFFVLIVWMFCLFIRELFRREKGHSFLRIATTITGVLLCAFLLGHLILIRDLRLVAGEGFRFIGRELVFFLFFVIWSVDTGAYVIGRWIGRFPLAPRLSPKKTWEGTLGGLLMGILVGWFYREAFLSEAMGPMEAVVYSLLIGVVAQISDLIESLLKRTFSVKDSSHLLPGHGGLLDRFDSFIFVAPFFYYLLLGTSRFQ